MNFNTTLNLPECQCKIRISPKTGQEEIFDVQRGKYVKLTPEEWVRQHFVNYLITVLNFPKARIGNEIPIKVGLTEKRCDTVVFNQYGEAAVIVEYKAASVPLTQKVFNQIMRYDITLQVEYLIVSNGLQTYCCHLNRQLGKFEFLPEIPDWSSL